MNRSERDPLRGLAVFDIDGTLTDTMDVDVECFEAAIRDVLGVEVPRDWDQLDDVTDATILRATCARAGIAEPQPDVEARVAERVGLLLEEQLAVAPDRFRPIPGARSVLGSLAGRSWGVAMATGAWRPSALVKLRGAGIHAAAFPLATSSERVGRQDIIRRAMQPFADARARARVYFGDGLWDARAALALGFTFVGIAKGQRARRLMEAGAYVVLPDFADLDAVHGVLAELAGPPEGGS